MYGGWRFIHSQNFSEKASLKVSEILTKKAGAKLSFDGVDFNFFPPATIFKNVKVTKNDPTAFELKLEAKEVKVSFTYSSFISSDLEIDELSLKDGAVNVQIAKIDTPEIKWGELNTIEVFKKYSLLLQELPIHLNIANVENMKLSIDHSIAFVKMLSIAPHKKELKLKTQLLDIKINNQQNKATSIEFESVNTLFTMNKSKFKFDNLEIMNKDGSLVAKALFFNKAKKLETFSEVNFKFNAKNVIENYLQNLKSFSSIQGLANGRMKVTGSVIDPAIVLDVNFSKFNSPWVQMASVKINLKNKKNVIFLEQLLAQNGEEEYSLLKAYPVYDLNKKIFIKGKISLYLKNAFTNNFLYSIKESMSGLKSYFTGKVDVSWNGDNVTFDIAERSQLKDFRLMSSTSKTPILKNNMIFLENTSLILHENLNLSIKSKILFNNTVLNTVGEITSKDINISIKDSKLDMKAFGPISGVSITGSGPTSAEIHGPIEDVKFDFIVDWNNFSVVDLNFGHVKSLFTFSLKDLDINIDHLIGKFNQSNFVASGVLGFGDESNMNLKLDFANTNFTDAQKMYALVFKNIKLPFAPELNFSTTYLIQGGYGIDELNIKGKVKGSELKILGEEAEKLSLNFDLKNSVLNFKDIKINKSRGEINSSVSINLANNYTELEGSLSGLRLRDFNFYKKTNLQYDGDLVIDFDGNGTKNNFSSRFKLKLNNTFIDSIPASPSSALIYLNNQDVVVNASLLSGKIRLDSNINLQTNQVSLKSKVESSDLRELLGIIAGHNISEKTISGKVRANFNALFNLSTFVVNNFSLELPVFNLKKNDVNLKVDPIHNSVSIIDGLVKSWDLRFKDGVNFFASKASNGPGGSIVYDQVFSVKSSMMEFLTSQIEKATGEIKGVVQFVVDKKLAFTKFDINAQKNSFKIRSLQGVVSSVDFNFVKKENIFELTNLAAKYGEGDVSAKGTFYFDDLFPQVNLEYKIDRSNIPLFKRSSLLVSSTGTISGTDLPYKLTGKLSILHGEILDDPNEFTKESKVSLDNFKKYLPEKNALENRGFLNLLVNFESINPVSIKNNLSEVYVKGNGLVVGDVLSPEINARIEILPTVSKFKFKGHDFSLNQGYVEIRDRGKSRSSDLKFLGLSKINDYDVKLDISGSIEKMNINLSSEPALTQEDLVSLLTLGVTSDISKNLEASERKSVTTLGIGALLFEQLKINEDLNSTLGLKLSVLPEFKEDESSLIQGKSAVSEGSSSKLKSATKIKINKQITQAVDVSVSSTVGGSIEQTQEMNINYNINKKFSIEGVYEVKPSEDENTNTPNSIGADIKYRWSF